MMKHISKAVLLFSAFAIMTSTIPIQAAEAVVEEEVVMTEVPEALQQEVAQKQGFFSGWTQEALRMRLSNLMKELDKHWANFMKCVKREEGCDPALIKTIGGILAAAIAIVGIVKTRGWIREQAGRVKGKLFGPRIPAGKEEEEEGTELQEFTE